MNELTDFELAVQEFQKAALAELVLEAKTKRQAAEVMLEKAKLERMEAEEVLNECRLNREFDKLRRRPSQDRWVEIEYDADKEQWAARYQDVVAYGDTPEMACDNFDHLWVYGDAK